MNNKILDYLEELSSEYENTIISNENYTDCIKYNIICDIKDVVRSIVKEDEWVLYTNKRFPNDSRICWITVFNPISNVRSVHRARYINNHWYSLTVERELKDKDVLHGWNTRYQVHVK